MMLKNSLWPQYIIEGMEKRKRNDQHHHQQEQDDKYILLKPDI